MLYLLNMEFILLEKNLKAIQALYPNTEGEPRYLKVKTIQGLPIWMKDAIDICELPFVAAMNGPLYLVMPKAKIEFEHLMRIYRQLSDKLTPNILIIADHLPPKYRPLLVKFRLPFIYKDESIFAPNLGLKIKNLKKFETKPKFEIKNEEALTPFALKIIAGLLTNNIPQEFTLKFLHENILQRQVSLSKISMTLHDLAENGVLLVQGAGPKKYYSKNAVQKIWEKTLSSNFAPFFREMKAHYIPEEREVYSVAGETALAHYSNLAAPKQQTIAMTAGTFRRIYQGSGKTIPDGDWNSPSVVQIWKENPHLFSIDGVMSPIEVFFAMRLHSDERVQLSLDEMIRRYGLARKEE